MIVGVKNTCEFTFPGGEPWSLRARVLSAPRDTGRGDRREYQFKFPPTRWGRGGVAENATDSVRHDIPCVPPYPGVRQLEFTLMRGSKPFEPCAGTPEHWFFKIAEYDPLTTAKAEILHVNLAGQFKPDQSRR